MEIIISRLIAGVVKGIALFPLLFFIMYILLLIFSTLISVYTLLTAENKKGTLQDYGKSFLGCVMPALKIAAIFVGIYILLTLMYGVDGWTIFPTR